MIVTNTGGLEATLPGAKRQEVQPIWLALSGETESQQTSAVTYVDAIFRKGDLFENYYRLHRRKIDAMASPLGMDRDVGRLVELLRDHAHATGHLFCDMHMIVPSRDELKAAIRIGGFESTYGFAEPIPTSVEGNVLVINLPVLRLDSNLLQGIVDSSARFDNQPRRALTILKDLRWLYKEGGHDFLAHQHFLGSATQESIFGAPAAKFPQLECFASVKELERYSAVLGGIFYDDYVTTPRGAKLHKHFADRTMRFVANVMQHQFFSDPERNAAAQEHLLVFGLIQADQCLDLKGKSDQAEMARCLIDIAGSSSPLKLTSDRVTGTVRSFNSTNSGGPVQILNRFSDDLRAFPIEKKDAMKIAFAYFRGVRKAMAA